MAHHASSDSAAGLGRGSRKANGQPVSGGQLCLGWNQRHGIPCRQPPASCRGCAGALQPGVANPAAAIAERTVRRQSVAHCPRDNPALDRSPAADRLSNCCDPARRVNCRSLLSGHPLRRHSFIQLDQKSILVRLCHCSLFARNGKQRSHGNRTGHGAAVRPGIPFRFFQEVVEATVAAVSQPVGNMGPARSPHLFRQ